MAAERSHSSLLKKSEAALNWGLTVGYWLKGKPWTTHNQHLQNTVVPLHEGRWPSTCSNKTKILLCLEKQKCYYSWRQTLQWARREGFFISAFFICGQLKRRWDSFFKTVIEIKESSWSILFSIKPEFNVVAEAVNKGFMQICFYGVFRENKRGQITRQASERASERAVAAGWGFFFRRPAKSVRLIKSQTAREQKEQKHNFSKREENSKLSGVPLGHFSDFIPTNIPWVTLKLLRFGWLLGLITGSLCVFIMPQDEIKMLLI